MNRAFVDTNVVVYATSSDPRRFTASAVLTLAPVISTQVLNEFVNTARRKLAFDWAAVTASIEDLLRLCPVVMPITATTHENARTIAERYKICIYDACILASALEAKCAVLYSEDMHDGLVINDRLTIRNPFA